jgi:hypothetical protein
MADMDLANGWESLDYLLAKLPANAQQIIAIVRMK